MVLFVDNCTQQRTPREPNDEDDNKTEKSPTDYRSYAAGVSETRLKEYKDACMQYISPISLP